MNVSVHTEKSVVGGFLLTLLNKTGASRYLRELIYEDFMTSTLNLRYDLLTHR